MIKILTLISLLLLIKACNFNLHSYETSKSNKTLKFESLSENENYSYKYDYGHCTTENHFFTSKEAYCKALINEELNNYCALDQRQNDVQTHCENLSIAKMSPSKPKKDIISQEALTLKKSVAQYKRQIYK